MPDAESSSSGIDMARRRPSTPLRNSAGGQGPSTLGVAMPRADEHPDNNLHAYVLKIEDDNDPH